MNVASPPMAATVAVPSRTPTPPGLERMLTVTLSLAVGTVTPFASATATRSTGLSGPVATLFPGVSRITSFAGAPTVIANVALVSEASAPEVARSVSPAPMPFNCRSANVVIPPTAAFVSVPLSAAPCGLASIATVTFPAKAVAVFPNASRAVTTTAGEIDVFGRTSVG